MIRRGSFIGSRCISPKAWRYVYVEASKEREKDTMNAVVYFRARAGHENHAEGIHVLYMHILIYVHGQNLSELVMHLLIVIYYILVYIRLFVVHFRSWNINFGVIIYALNPPTSAFNAVYIYNIHYYAIHLSYVLYPRK